MEEWMDGFNKSFFGTLEGSLEKLPKELLGELYRPCAVACVQAYVLGEQRRQFAECGNSLDLQYEKYGMQQVIPEKYNAMAAAKATAKASACIECGVCETRCPYDIPIRERMKKIAQDLG